MNAEDSDNENNNTRRWATSQQRKMCYRKLLDNIETIEESQVVDVGAAQKIGEILKEANSIEAEYNITERYQHPEETLLDCLLVSSASNIVIKCAESIDVNICTYTPSEFAEQIKTSCNQEGFHTEDLLNLLSDAQHIIPQIPKYNYVYGSYDLQNLPTPKPKKERAKQQKEKFQRKEPEKVTNLKKDEKGIDEIVKTLFDVLNECFEKNNEQSIKYYDYVVDTSSFSNTVENMFYCSFLIRDGQACIDLDNKGEPYIKPMKKRQFKEFRKEGGINSQIISVLTIPEWELFQREGFIQKYKMNRQ